MEKMSKMLMAEVFLRVLSMVLASVAAIVLGLDAETKKVVFFERRAHVKDLQALWVLSVVASVAAGYQFLQLCRCAALAWLGKNPSKCDKFSSWVCLVFDQAFTYATFGASLAAAQGSLVAVMGVKQLQWTKLCNIYTRFCIEAGLGILIGGLASMVMQVASSLSACNLFRLCPSDRHPSFTRFTQ